MKNLFLALALMVFSTSVIAEEAKQAAPKDPFSNWYREGSKLIVIPGSFDDSSKSLVKTLREQFTQQISMLPDTEWQSTKKLAGNKTKEQIEADLKSMFAYTQTSSGMATDTGESPSYGNGLDANASKLASCAWHFYYLSMQAKDPKDRAYTEASTKVLLSAATAVSKIGSQYDSGDNKFNAEANDKAIWEALLGAEKLVFKMAEAAKAKNKADSDKYQGIFNNGTKECQSKVLPVAAKVLLKANSKL